MRILFICLILLNYISAYSLIIKDPVIKPPKKGQEAISHEIMPPYNPRSIYVPTTNLLAKLPAERILDMGASAYGSSFGWKALYFYTNAINLFPNDPKITAWANYESGFVYYRRRQYHKALEYFDRVLNIKGAPVAAQNLAKFMSNRLRNIKEYKVFLKQEDLVFLEDKRAKAILDRQISKEEKIAEKSRRALAKERKKREKEEKIAIKKAKKEAEIKKQKDVFE